MSDGKIPHSKPINVRVTAAISVLVGASPRRRGLTIFPPIVASVILGTREMLAAGVGMTFPAFQRPYHLCAYTHGDWIQQDIYVVATGVDTMAILEVLED